MGFAAIAQQPEPLIATVNYTFTHVFDTTDRNHPLQEKMNLYLGQNSSSYRRAPYSSPNPVPVPSATTPVRTGAIVMVSGSPMAVVSAPGISTAEVFQYPATGELKSSTYIAMNDYVVEDKLPVIKWQVSTETKTIGQFKCQQATGSYAGRTYTVWFAPELPFHNGPWKLNGLPGLILEAKDGSGDVTFTFDGFQKADSNQTTTSIKRRLITTTEKALSRVREAFEENPVATMQAQLPAGASQPKLAYRDVSGKTVTGDEAQEMLNKKKSAKFVINNPLELKK